MSKETFKTFAKNNPSLAEYVLENKVSWQQLYELYEIYGENNEIWNKFTKNKLTDNINQSTNTIKDFINKLKDLDVDSIQKGIDNISKTIGLFQDIGLTNNKQPIYKRFEK